MAAGVGKTTFATMPLAVFETLLCISGEIYNMGLSRWWSPCSRCQRVRGRLAPYPPRSTRPAKLTPKASRVRPTSAHSEDAA